MVYLNQFDPILTPRKLKFWKKIDFFFVFFFVRKTDKVSKKFLFFRKLTQIAVIFMVLKLNYHKNSQRYIEFNFDPKNNFFQLKSGIFIKFRKFCKLLAKSLQIFKFGVLSNLTSRVLTHRKLSFWEILYHLGDENTSTVFELFIFL